MSGLVSLSAKVSHGELTEAPLTAAESRAITWRVIGVIAVLAVFRLWFLQIVPLDLAADEAYYWDWSRQLDWGYYSKPPMIAWIAFLSTWCGGLSEPVLRTPAVICGGLALWAVFGTARAMYGSRVGWWAFLTAAATPGNAAMSLFMTIDAPFLCAWCFAVWCVWELFRSEQPASGWLPLAIICTGLGLLSKQTMLALIPLIGLWLLLRSERAWSPWRTYAVWAVSSLSFCLPALFWNLLNGWLTLQHTREHFQWREMPWTRHLTFYAEFAASQAGILSPLTYLLITILGLGALSTWRRQADRERFVLCLGLLPLLAITGLSFLQRIQPNWPVAFHLTGMILLAAWAGEAWSSGWLSSGRRWWFGASLASGAAFVLAFYAMPLAMPQTPWIGSAIDPLSRLRGWKELAATIHHLRPAESTPTRPLIVTMSGRGIVSELAFYLPDHPRVYHWNAAGTIVSQHDVWGGPKEIHEQDALLVTASGQPVPDAFLNACGSAEFLQTVRQERGGKRHDDYDVWIVHHLREWPRPTGAGGHSVSSPIVSRVAHQPRKPAESPQ